MKHPSGRGARPGTSPRSGVRAAWCTVLVGALAGPAMAAQEVPPPFAIRNVRIFDGTATRDSQTVVVERGMIVAVGTSVRPPEGVPVIEGGGRTLLPGFIDSHTHTIFAQHLRQALVFGVTTELDMFTMHLQAAAIKREQAAGGGLDMADLRSAGTLVTAPGGHGTEYGLPIPTLSGPGEARSFVEARIREGSDYIKIVYDARGPAATPFPSIDRATLEAAIRAAHEAGKLAIVHVMQQRSAREAVEAGADGLAHIFMDEPPDPAFVALAKEHGIFVVPTLGIIEAVAGRPGGVSLATDPSFSPYLTPEDREQLGRRFGSPRPGALEHALAAVRALDEAGVPILAGTDAPNPGTVHGASLHRELELLVEAGLTPLEALTAATSAPARAFGLGDRGRIVPGKRADLVLVEGDPTRDISATRAILEVWKAGVRLDRAAYRRAVDESPAGAVDRSTGGPGFSGPPNRSAGPLGLPGPPERAGGEPGIGEPPDPADGGASLQERPGPALRVFVDCQSGFCDLDFFRREIPFVNYVRDRRDAQVHLLLTSQRTGAGGIQFSLDFLGREEFQGLDDRIEITTRANLAEEEVLSRLSQAIRLGLMRYLARTPARDRVRIVYEAEAGEPAAAEARDDPWNFWVFRTSFRGGLNGEARRNSLTAFGSFSADRITPGLKVELSMDGSYRESNFETSDTTTVTSITRRYELETLVAWSLGDHWSAGTFNSAEHSSFRNRQLAVRLAPALEYNLFSYEESERKQLTFLYSIGVNNLDWKERTIFGKTSERRLDQALRVSLRVRQPWGEAGGRLEASHFLDDPGQNRVEAGLGVRFRLFRGLSLDVTGEASRVRDQINLPAGDATEEEVLLRIRELQTGFEYGMNFGFSYTFGSIFSNVVNPRF